MPKFSELLAVLTGKLLLPIICELDNETGNPIAIKLVVACDGKREVIELYSRTVNDSVESSGEVRVNVKGSMVSGPAIGHFRVYGVRSGNRTFLNYLAYPMSWWTIAENNEAIRWATAARRCRQSTVA